MKVKVMLQINGRIQQERSDETWRRVERSFESKLDCRENRAKRLTPIPSIIDSISVFSMFDRWSNIVEFSHWFLVTRTISKSIFILNWRRKDTQPRVLKLNYLHIFEPKKNKNKKKFLQKALLASRRKESTTHRPPFDSFTLAVPAQQSHSKASVVRRHLRSIDWVQHKPCEQKKQPFSSDDRDWRQWLNATERDNATCTMMDHHFEWAELMQHSQRSSCQSTRSFVTVFIRFLDASMCRCFGRSIAFVLSRLYWWRERCSSDWSNNRKHNKRETHHVRTRYFFQSSNSEVASTQVNQNKKKIKEKEKKKLKFVGFLYRLESLVNS